MLRRAGSYRADKDNIITSASSGLIHGHNGLTSAPGSNNNSNNNIKLKLSGSSHTTVGTSSTIKVRSNSGDIFDDIEGVTVTETHSMMDESSDEDKYRDENIEDDEMLLTPESSTTIRILRDNAGVMEPWTFNTLKWFYYPNTQLYDTTFMFSIAGELFLLIVIIGWSVTLIYHPDTVKDNPILPIIGYNNVCVGLDLPPALYIIAPIYVAVAYFQLSYCQMTLKRIKMERDKAVLTIEQINQWKYYFIIYSHWLFAIGTAIFSLCFVIHPWESIRGHTRPFEFYMISRSLINISIYFEDSLHIHRNKTFKYRPELWIVQTYLILLTLTSCLLPLFWELSISYHEAYPHSKPLLPWEMVCALDYIWIVLVAFQASFLPDRPIVVGDEVRNRQSLFDLANKFKSLVIPKSATTELSERKMSEVTLTEAICHNFANDAQHPTLGNEHVGYSIALLHCELEIDERLSPGFSVMKKMKTGLFSCTGRYPGVVRINVTANAVVRMSIRIQIPKNVPGMEVLKENCVVNEIDDNYYYIDFLLAEWFKSFFFSNLDELHITQTIANKGITSCPLHNLSSIKSLFLSFYHIINNFKLFNNSIGIVGKEYYGGLPFYAGKDGACKWGLRPVEVEPGTNTSNRSPMLRARTRSKSHDSAANGSNAPSSPSWFGVSVNGPNSILTNNSNKNEEEKVEINKLLPDEMVNGKPTSSIWLKGKELEAVEKYRKALEKYFDNHEEALWDFVVQIATDESCNVEDGYSQWDEKRNPYIPIGSFRIKRQPLDHTHELYQYRDQLQFNPWNMLQAHRPLGELQRARKFVYNAHSSTHHGMTKVPILNDMSTIITEKSTVSYISPFSPGSYAPNSPMMLNIASPMLTSKCPFKDDFDV